VLGVQRIWLKIGSSFGWMREVLSFIPLPGLLLRGWHCFGVQHDAVISRIFLAHDLFFFFLESIRLISLRLCGAPVPSPLKVRYTHGKTGYINVLPSNPKKYLRKYPSSATTPTTGPSPIKVCLRLHAPSGPPHTYMTLPPPRPYRPSPKRTNFITHRELNQVNLGEERLH